VRDRDLREQFVQQPQSQCDDRAQNEHVTKSAYINYTIHDVVLLRQLIEQLAVFFSNLSIIVGVEYDRSLTTE
jgi:hypothetical protein